MFSKKTLIATVTLAAFIATGCAVSNTMSEEEIGLRKTSLYAENSTTADKTSYSSVAAGESKVYERAFENAPPMIPHSVEGMLPITMADNQCIACHDPAVAPSMNATSMPKSHLASFRPKTKMVGNAIIKDGKAVDNTADVLTSMHKAEGISMERYNCSQCHAPQSNNALIVENEFQPEFRGNGAKQSNLLDTINEGVK